MPRRALTRHRGGRVALALVALAAAVAGGSIDARARDSLAPPGAGDRWLPCEEWVMMHWLPYDERQLFRALRITRRDARRWLRDDDVHNLAQLARRRGLDPQALAHTLVARWAGGMAPEQVAVLRDRALRTLTQGHLAQHVFFHLSHHPDVALNARWIFGIPPLHYKRLRGRSYTPAQIAELGGQALHTVLERTSQVLAQSAARGVRDHATPVVQARRFLRYQRQNLVAWLHYPLHGPAPSLREAPPQRPADERSWRSREALLCRLLGSGRRH